MGKLFYQLFISLYPVAIRVAAIFNGKARLWTAGRRNIFEQIKRCDAAKQPTIWMHCASLGEFEQGRPLLEKLRLVYPGYKILLTFFSPSGYEVRREYAGADYIFYLPMDGRKNTRRFFDSFDLKLVVFVKYEFWYYYLAAAKRRQVPLLLVSAVFRKGQRFFSTFGSFQRSMLRCFTHLFVQNEESVQLLGSIGITNTSVSGDTRFDRVIEIAEQFENIPRVAAFCGNHQVVVAGSTWLEDDKELAHFVNTNPQLRFIIAPHSVHKDRITECKKIYRQSVLFSEPGGANTTANCLIVDNVGMLSRLYKYATVAFVGGGFGADGIHNILEAAVFAKPVVFGYEYTEYVEAVDLCRLGGAMPVQNALELEKVLHQLLTEEDERKRRGLVSKAYVYSKQGSTDKILAFIQAKRLLTN